METERVISILNEMSSDELEILAFNLDDKIRRALEMACQKVSSEIRKAEQISRGEPTGSARLLPSGRFATCVVCQGTGQSRFRLDRSCGACDGRGKCELDWDGYRIPPKS